MTEQAKPRCLNCGRFKRRHVWHAPDGSGTVIEFRCVHVQSDSEGGWEHE